MGEIREGRGVRIGHIHKEEILFLFLMLRGSQTGTWISGRLQNLPHLQFVQTGPGLSPASYSVGTGGSSPRGKADSRTWSLTSTSAEPEWINRAVITPSYVFVSCSGLLVLGLVNTFRLATGRQVPIRAGQRGETQESRDLFTQPGRLASRKLTGRLPGSTRIYPLLCSVAGRSLSQQWCMCCL